MRGNDNLPSNKIVIEMQAEIGKVIKGLPGVIRLVTVATFSQGHILLEGLPGVAKTTLLTALAKTIGGGFSRISGTPDLMPNEFLYSVWPDIVVSDDPESPGSAMKKVKISDLAWGMGPLLKHGKNLALVLVDEINRIQSKTQSALLEVMQQKQITSGIITYSLPHVLFVATRNPLETGQNYDLPAAQLDRFMFEGHVPSPEPKVLHELIKNPIFQDINQLLADVKQIIDLSALQTIREGIQDNIKVSDEIADYIIRLSLAMWSPFEHGVNIGLELKEERRKALVRAGLSPRAQILLAQAARVVAWMDSRDYVKPSDIQEVFLDFGTHRFFLEPFAAASHPGLARAILTQIIQRTPAPMSVREA